MSWDGFQQAPGYLASAPLWNLVIRYAQSPPHNCQLQCQPSLLFLISFKIGFPSFWVQWNTPILPTEVNFLKPSCLFFRDPNFWSNIKPIQGVINECLAQWTSEWECSSHDYVGGLVCCVLEICCCNQSVVSNFWQDTKACMGEDGVGLQVAASWPHAILIHCKWICMTSLQQPVPLFSNLTWIITLTLDLSPSLFRVARAQTVN